MLAELRVRDLGVIADLELSLNDGLTALTGETGAGKTLIVEALQLLLGGRADPTVVRAGAEEALVEGRFFAGERGEAGEVVLARAVPAEGRSRAYVDGRMVPVARLEALGAELVDLHGQHAHQSLVRPAIQRQALDRFAGVDLGPLLALRREVSEIERRLDALGGDERARGRELDLLRFELDEIERAEITGADEQERLAAEEAVLAAASALREQAGRAHTRLVGEGLPGAVDLVGEALSGLGQLPGLEALLERLRAVIIELEDVAEELRLVAERAEEDPARLAVVRERRQMLRNLVRKHGDDLGDVLVAAQQARMRIAELSATDAARAELVARRAELHAAIAAQEGVIGDQRRREARGLAREVEAHLRQLALPRARLQVHLGDHGLADDVEFLLAANPGEPALPLAKVASGGELARAMLALRLVLTTAPPTLIFDEVDAGIGGEAAVAVGRALATLARDRQVVVVTHLPQVAACATHQLVVTKAERSGRTVTGIAAVEGDARVAELSRMLAGRRDSEAARRHARELLADAPHLDLSPTRPDAASRIRTDA